MSEQCLGYRPTPHPTHQHQFNPHSTSSAQCLSLSLLDIHVFISSPRVYITYTSLGYRDLSRVWHRLKHPPTPPTTPSIHNNPPTKATFHPPLVERIPICPGAKFQPCFARAERRASWCLPRVGPHLSPPIGPKNATNYWGSNAEGFLLTPDRYCWGSELTLPDTLGDGGGTYCLERAWLYHILLLCDTESDHSCYDTEVISIYVTAIFKSCWPPSTEHTAVEKYSVNMFS